MHNRSGCLQINKRLVLLLTVPLICCLQLQGQTEKYIQTLTGILKKGDSCVVVDDKFHDAEKWATIEKNMAVSNLLTFEIRYDTVANYFNRNFSCTLQVDIEYKKADNTTQQLHNIELEVNYDTGRGSVHQGIAYYKFSNAHYVKLTIKKISSAAWGNKIPPMFRIKNEIFIERKYVLDVVSTTRSVNAYPVTGPATSIKSKIPMRAMGSAEPNDVPGQQVIINWDGNNPAFPQYDFEWTFYDDHSLIGSQLNVGMFDFNPEAMASVFRNNCSRVTVSMPSYQLNVLYNKGWVFHRVRGIRYDESSGERTEGAWSYAGAYNFQGTSYGLFRSNGHETGLNWQYNAAFSEEGKRKEIVNYFDGSLRNRQAVTLNNDNTGSRAIVQENVFDAQGRPAVHVLPGPTDENSVHYFHAFNKSAVTGLPYDYTDIETTASCGKIPASMNPSSGTSQYFSPLNPWKDDNSSAFYFTKYIPDAKGFPFAVTSFTPDNTGRVRSQGGVGMAFQPGATNITDDHTTRYFYAKPQQDELDRLFGNETGNASHYLKNMIIDANGQASVSYLNAAGKTVATALAGKNPENLEPLPSYRLKNTTIISNLTDRDNIVRDAANLTLTYSGSFLAAAAGSFTLKYAFTPLSLQVLYGIQNEKICADCYYDLLVNVTDNCGNAVQSLDRQAIFTEKTSCNPAPTEQEGSLPVTIPQPGEYNITYQLKLSRKAIEFYLDQYLVQNLSIKKEIDFQRDYLHRVDISQCFNDCVTCIADLGTQESFIARMTAVLLQEDKIVPNAADLDWIKSMYKRLLDECTLLQQGCGKTSSPCEEQTIQLKDDVSPGGQYMLYDAATRKFIDRDVNVFLKNLPALTVNVIINGQSKPFNQLTEAEVISNWQDQWAYLLLPYHPENRNNCLITGCGKNAESEVFDNSFINTATADLARTRMFWAGDNYLAVVNNDPYFKSDAEGATLKGSFIGNLNNFRNTGVDIMSFVRWSVYCQDKTVNNNYPASIGACPRTPACNREEDEWMLFRILYYSAKQEIRDINTNCGSADLFPDPTAMLAHVTDPSVIVPEPCTDASLFQISNSNSVISIQYNGVQKTPKDVTIDYFAVDNNNQLVAGSQSSMQFPAGTIEDATQTATGKPDLSYVINFARCDLSHPYYTKVRRNYSGLDVLPVTNQLKSKTDADLNAGATAAMLNECNESCEQQADGWMQKLDGCNLDLKAAEYNKIRDGLIAVCKGSCQVDVQNHPFGASSVPVATTAGDMNFRDVLLRVLGAQRFSSACNDLLLDFPPAIGATPLYVNERVRTLQSCAYDKLQSWKRNWQSSGSTGGFAAYIVSRVDPAFSLTDADINQLESAYENNCVTPVPLLLPASLSCNASTLKTCLSCSDLRDARLLFSQKYQYIAEQDPAYYELLAKYINQQYTFNLSSVDVYNALQQCNEAATASPADSIPCAKFRESYQHFVQLRQKYFTNQIGKSNIDSLYEIHLTLWLNTELHRHLDFDYYKHLAVSCGIVFNYPGNEPVPACDTVAGVINYLPQFITCCDRFTEMENFKEVFPDSIDARLMALYFSLQRTQSSAPINLPVIDYLLDYDSLVHYFNSYNLADSYNLVVRPDSLISLTIINTGSCHALAFNFNTDPATTDTSMLYAVCNKPLQPLQNVDDNSCVKQQVDGALSNAHSDYTEYIKKIKRDYRSAYYTKCLSITPRLTIEAIYNQPPEYHYTLYYYDQSGNLVKTIPPAGVQPLDESPDGQAKMERVRNSRLADKDYCYEYGDAPAMDGNARITVADNPLIGQTTLPFTIEAFVNFNSLNGDQAIITKQSVNPSDNKIDGYKVYLSNGRLMVDYAAHGAEQWIQTLSKLVPYTRPAPFNTLPSVDIRTKVDVTVSRSLYRDCTAEITSDLAGLVITGQWNYIAIENTGGRDAPVRIYINGNLVSSRLLTDNFNYTPASSPSLTAADIAAGTVELSFAFKSVTVPLNVTNSNAADFMIGAAGSGLEGNIKQVRLYNRALPETEIQSNAFNTCLVPQSEAALVLWLPLNKEEMANSSQDRINQLYTSNSGTIFSDNFQPEYPVHQFPVHYYYNSLNNVTRQISPDAGETNFFYDLPGRLVVSQNSEQKTSTRGEPNNRYSYTSYDLLGRVNEVGEKMGAAAITNDIVKTDALIPGTEMSNWLKSGTNIQITQTIYDQPDPSVVTDASITNSQVIYHTSRKRVVAVMYRNTNTSSSDYNNATHFQYDISGNIKRLWQEQKKSVSGATMNLLKDFQYDYDLASGKVNNLIYQKGKGDQFVYKYEYDPDNRLLRTYSGRDFNTLQQDVGYRYYLHGPLARSELGDGLTNRLVQGCDYTYTLQGWLKAVNGIRLAGASATVETADAGADGAALAGTGIHAEVAQDALAFTLGYYANDYTPIGSGLPVFSNAYQPPLPGSSEPTGKALFNGNISNATYAIGGIDNGNTRGYTYGYDQLSRLKGMRAHSLAGIATGINWNNNSAMEDHKENFSYDANGNIAQLVRNGTGNANRSLSMDDLTYHYYYYTLNNTRKTYAPGQSLPADAWVMTNQLSHIQDAVAAAAYPSTSDPAEKDIDDQAADNYTYDGIGNLVKDNAEGVVKIEWTVYGKIRGIQKADGTSILYDYDASGNRIQKQVVSAGKKTIVNYLRDAQGNTFSVYGWQGQAGSIPIEATAGNGFSGQTWDEQHLYGSSRLGMWKPGVAVPTTLNSVTDAVQVGSKFFELTNHLGNVLAVISDRKIAVPATGEPSVTDHYTADIISAGDYTPFGMQMVGRTYHHSPSLYHYGFNGKENDDEVKGEGGQQDYGMRVYDGRVGRFLSADPIAAQYPMLSAYQFGSNSPVSGIDQDGLEYSPAGKIGIFSIDQTAVQLYPNNPKVILQQQEDAPARHLLREMARINSRPPPTVSPAWQPNEFEKWRHEINKRTWYDNDGYNEDGTPKPATRLMNNKTWNSFANNLALPTLDVFSYAEGIGEGRALLKGTITFLEKKEFQALATEGVVDAKMIRFSQDNINFKFQNGGNIQDLIDLLKTGSKVNIPPIRIVEKEGMIYTLDNRRLYVFQQAGVKVPYVKLDKIPPKELVRKFSTENDGISILVRGKK